MRLIQRLSLRAKLTLVFAAVMALVLAGMGSFLFFRTKANLDDAIRDSLRSRAGTLAEAVRSGGRDIPPGERDAEIAGRDGTVMAGHGELLHPSESAELTRARFFERGEHDRVLAEPVGDGLVVAVNASLADREEALEGLQGALFVGGPLALLLASALGYGVAGAALRPVELMRRRAQDISKADSATQLPVPDGRDEIHRLAVTLNEMLGRLGESAERERAFVANASHELRTPLAAIRAELELAVRHARTVEEFRDAAVAAIRDGDGLSRLADDLLVLARADNGALPMHAEDIDVPELLRAVAAETDAGERPVRVGAVEVAAAHGDPVRLQQALRNMVGNAVVHGAGTITLSAERRNGAVELRVTDEGTPVDPDTLATAFDRFARGPASAEGQGAGLGLAIVREIARLHGGDARLVNAPTGVACAIDLPATARGTVTEGIAGR